MISRVHIIVEPLVPEAIRGLRHREPVTAGIPLPRGAAPARSRFLLIAPGGVRQPVDATVLDRWPDGSARWVLLDFQADFPSGEALVLEWGPPTAGAETDADAEAGADAEGLTIAHRDAGVVIDTGEAAFRLRPGSDLLVERLVGDVPAALARLHVIEGSGAAAAARFVRTEVEHRGDLRAVVRLEGSIHGARDEHLLDLFARVHVFWRSAVVKCELTIRNPRAAAHPGGYWDLGDPASRYLRELTVVLSRPEGAGPGRVRCSREAERALEPCPDGFELYQDSSGGDAWRSHAHVNRRGEVPVSFCGYEYQGCGGRATGRRATPVAALEGDGVTLGVAVPQFWQNFPMALAGAGDGLRLSLYPRRFADEMELQPGEQKTYVFSLALGEDRISDVPLDWCRRPLVARTTPEVYRDSGVVPGLSLTSDDPDDPYERLVSAALDSRAGFEARREIVDEYGWRHFGDLYADHEAVKHSGPEPLVSHYNNQYDALAGFAYQFMRSGDVRWLALHMDLARHVYDIDVYHTAGDKSAYNGGLFWHTYHYIDAGTSTHRCYPRASRVGGGGPSAEHNYNTGLMVHHWLTGDAQSRDAAIALGQWVIDMDDGRQTVFRWLDRGCTGLASASGSMDYHGPGRGSGNSLVALMNAHRLTGDAVHLEKCEQLIRRCIHPSDDIEARNLLDTERRWFYTVFLQALAQFLEYKAEVSQPDEMYAYARESLLHYGRWMAAHEYPYLEKPGKLEFPTETWAAQDLRKAEVFEAAARHADGPPAAAAFEEKARYFREQALSTLLQWPTRSTARPLAIMMGVGFRRRLPPAPPSGAARSAGAPERFVTQKARALRRAAEVAAVGLAAAVVTLLWVIL